MGLKTFRPFTPSLRWTAISDFSELSPKHKRPEKKLTEELRSSGGRNSSGRMTSRRRGGGHRRRYRIIDFKRDKLGMPARVLSVEYDPNRSARIALIEFEDKERRYILAPVGITVGRAVSNGPAAEILPGNALPLENIPLGTQVHNIEFERGRGGQIVRSAGGYAILMAKEGIYAHVKLPSGEVRLIPANCYATIGQVGNIDHENLSLGKSSGGRQPTSRSGVLAKGFKTRRKKKHSSKYIVQGRPR